jgi:hypothetical protein
VLTACDPTADGIVDRSDIAILAQHFGGGDGAFDERADCNNDRALDLHDLWSIQKSQLDASPPVATLDYGDAPAPYPTRVADDGAAHDTRGNDIFLGHRRDTDADGQPGYQALGDDVLDGDDDEDGVIFFSNGTPGWRQHLDVKASMNGSLDAWVDFNRDGRWDAHEQVFQSEQLVPGPNHLSFLVPADAIAEENVDQPTYARFRISSAGGLMPTGIARDGEVEDHAYTIVPSLGGSPKPAAASALNPQPQPPDKSPLLNPQPLPPDKAPRLNPQPLPPDKSPMLNPQPLPPDKSPLLNPQPLPPDKSPLLNPQPLPPLGTDLSPTRPFQIRSSARRAPSEALSSNSNTRIGDSVLSRGLAVDLAMRSFGTQ